MSGLETWWPFMTWLGRVSLEAGVLIVLVAAIVTLLRDRMPARWRYLLWALVLVKLALPWSPGSDVSVYRLLTWRADLFDAAVVDVAAPTSLEAAAPVEVPRTQAAPPLGDVPRLNAPERMTLGQPGSRQPGSQQPGWRVWIAAAWAVGALGVIAIALGQTLRLSWALRGQRLVTDQPTLDLLEDCRRLMGVRTFLAVVASDRVRGPALFGFIRPRLLLPADAAATLTPTLTPTQLRHIFMHELAHVKRSDVAVACVSALLLALHWFNPLVWFAMARLRTERELACDALVLERLGDEGPRQYGWTLIRLLEQQAAARFAHLPRVPNLAGVVEDAGQTKRRVTMISRFRQATWGQAAAAALVLLCVAGIGLTAARGEDEPSDGQSDEQLETPATLADRATAFVTLLAQKQFDEAHASFAPVMKQAISREGLRQAWEQLLATAGDYQRINDTTTTQAGGFDVVYVTTQFADTMMNVKVVYDAAGLVSGLWFEPVAAKQEESPPNEPQVQTPQEPAVPEWVSQLPHDVSFWILGEHMAAMDQAQALGIAANTHIHGVDAEFEHIRGGLLTYVNRTGAPVEGEVHLGNFGRQKPDISVVDDTGRPADVTFRPRPGATIGQHALWWRPREPIAAGAVRVLGYISQGTETLPIAEGDGAWMTMQNHFGAPVLESFFLVLPPQLQVAEASVEPKSRTRVGAHDVYLWQRQVPADNNNLVNVRIRVREGADDGEGSAARPGVSKPSMDRSADVRPAADGITQYVPLNVLLWLTAEHMSCLGQAQAKHIYCNTHIHTVDEDFSHHFGGFLTYYNDTGQTVTGAVHLGNFGSDRPDHVIADMRGRAADVTVRENATQAIGRYALWWRPDEPIPPGSVQVLSYMRRNGDVLAAGGGDSRWLTMQNHFGSPVLENFFLVLPVGMKVSSGSPAPTKVTRVGDHDVYLWQREVPEDTTNRVKARVAAARDAGAQREPRTPTRDQVIVEDLALAMLVAIRDKDDAKLQSLAVDKIDGWRDALPHFAMEGRERFRQHTGKEFTLYPGESLVEGNRAVVKCTGPDELDGMYLVLFFIKTDEGWRNWNMRNSPPRTPLSEHLKLDADAPSAADALH